VIIYLPTVQKGIERAVEECLQPKVVLVVQLLLLNFNHVRNKEYIYIYIYILYFLVYDTVGLGSDSKVDISQPLIHGY